MANIGSYPIKVFDDEQEFLVRDPDTQSMVRVQARSLLDFIGPRASTVNIAQTRVAATNENYLLGEVIQTLGDTSTGDDGAALYLVVEGGTGDFPMLNGNDLLYISDGGVSLRGTVDITQPINITPELGDLYIVSPGGIADESFTGIGNSDIASGSWLLFDGTNWQTTSGSAGAITDFSPVIGYQAGDIVVYQSGIYRATVPTGPGWMPADWEQIDSTGLQAQIDGKADLSHTHIIADVTGLQTALDGKLSLTGGTMTGQINGITPTAAADLTRKDYVDAGLAGKANTSHTHVIGDVTGLQTALDGKLSLTGGTMTGAINGVTPTAAAHLTRKDYVDAAVAGAGAGDAVVQNPTTSQFITQSVNGALPLRIIPSATSTVNAFEVRPGSTTKFAINKDGETGIGGQPTVGTSLTVTGNQYVTGNVGINTAPLADTSVQVTSPAANIVGMRINISNTQRNSFRTFGVQNYYGNNATTPGSAMGYYAESQSLSNRETTFTGFQSELPDTGTVGNDKHFVASNNGTTVWEVDRDGDGYFAGNVGINAAPRADAKLLATAEGSDIVIGQFLGADMARSGATTFGLYTSFNNTAGTGLARGNYAIAISAGGAATNYHSFVSDMGNAIGANGAAEDYHFLGFGAGGATTFSVKRDGTGYFAGNVGIGATAAASVVFDVAASKSYGARIVNDRNTAGSAMWGLNVGAVAGANQNQITYGIECRASNAGGGLCYGVSTVIDSAKANDVCIRARPNGLNTGGTNNNVYNWLGQNATAVNTSWIKADGSVYFADSLNVGTTLESSIVNFRSQSTKTYSGYFSRQSDTAESSGNASAIVSIIGTSAANSTVTNPASQFGLKVVNFNSTVFSVKLDGTVTASGDITAFSDLKLKSDIQEIPNALEKVEQLTGYTYKRIDQDNAESAGLIAQEVEEVLPAAVKDNGGTLSLNYGAVTGLLVSALNEASDKIKEQQERIETLESEIEMIKRYLNL